MLSLEPFSEDQGRSAVHPRGIPPISFLAPYGFSNPLTRTHVRLLGPCFKTGRMGSPQADTRSTLVPKHTDTARAGFHNRGEDVSRGVSKARAWAATMIRVGPRPEPIGGPALASFSSFPRGTCSLSVSRPYLALDGIYRPIRAAFPNNPTHRQRLVVRQGPGTTGLSPSPAPRFSSWAIPGSLTVTKGILACFDNDPSAGSPTETLLRLLLPLNDKVQWTSRDVAGSEPPTSPRSEHFTGPFNRINQVAFLRDVRPACSSMHYLGRGEAITGQDHRSCRGTKCTSYERPGPRPYAHEIFRIQKHDRASMHRRGRIMPIDTLGTSSTTEVH
ncbi:hypothetical protein V6N13_008706 [Hibiscus sabdariffa]